jgi:hypothetical protein
VRFFLKNNKYSWVLVAHACNSSGTEGRDQKDCGSRQSRQNESKTLSQHKKKNLCSGSSACLTSVKPWVQVSVLQKQKKTIQKVNTARCQWLTSVILATQKAENRRTVALNCLFRLFLYLKNNPQKEGMQSVSSGRSRASHSRNPEFKPQCHKKKKKKDREPGRV